jgi:glycosyltransferase involved in cell wall biosynthesis
VPNDPSVRQTLKLVTAVTSVDWFSLEFMPEPSAIVAVHRDRPIRVLLASPPMNGCGGVAQYMRILRPHMRNDVQYFTIGSRSHDERIRTRLLRVAQDSLRFVRTLRRGSHDIVHLNLSIYPRSLLRDGTLLLIAKALRKTVVVFAHGWDDACQRVLSAHLSPLFRLVYCRADAFIVLNNEFKNRLRQLGYDGRVFVHRAPIEDELLQDCQHQQVRDFAGGASPKFNILFLARVEKEKGIYEALETYRLLKQEHSFVSLVVAGDGSQLNNAIEYARARQLADVSFVGLVEHAAKYQVLKRADAYLFPSYSEGLPLSVLEAMACGLPIVTSAVGGLRDFFQDGRMGFITQSRDPVILASLLSRLVYDPNLCSRISIFNHKYARDQFTAPQVAARLDEVYRFLREGSQPNPSVSVTSCPPKTPRFQKKGL